MSQIYQLRWLGHLCRMSVGHLPWEVFLAYPAGRRPRGRPRTRWSDYVTQLVWERLGILSEELEEMSGGRISGRKWMDGWMHCGKFYHEVKLTSLLV